MTRNSITGQVKALAMIVAMEHFIPDRRAVSAEKKSAPAPVNAQIYRAECLPRPAVGLRKQQAATIDPPPTPAPQEEASRVPEPDLAPALASEAPLDPVPSQPAFAHRVPLADGVPPCVPLFNSAPDTRVPFSIKVNPFKHRR
jgi:hypothetical protein